jgi:ADP-ribosylglycohydrolase
LHTIENKTVIPPDYPERVYAGWLGKVIGVRHGGNVENWSYEKLERAFGDLTGYVHHFKNFAADDDTNGPLFFLRALEDYTHTREITAEQIGLTWLNYAPDGHGFYWWGGYGISTEHTAYLNMKHGIMAPRSGSIAQNGKTAAEQIGGQIFIDVWGLIAPGNPELAAEYAEKAASVSHDGEGIYGGRFIAALIAAAFTGTSIREIIDRGLAVIPLDCEYTRMVHAVIDFHRRNPGNWRDGFRFVQENFGYDKYPGHCHIIPNSAVIVLSLLYADGDFSKAVNISTMCGWDTDCNAGNVGAIMGVYCGLDGIGEEWRKPINDFLCCSSVIGSLNILDIPWCAAYIAQFGYRIAGREVPSEWQEIIGGPAGYFHFEYPGSTHAMRLDTSDASHVTGMMMNSSEYAASGKRSLKIIFDKVQGGNAYRVYHQTYYRPDDFNDSRYDPAFSPILYPGQTVEAKVLLPEWAQLSINARLYVYDDNGQQRIYGDLVKMIPGEWVTLRFRIPFLSGCCLSQAGVELVPLEGANVMLAIYLDDMRFTGSPDYEIDFAKERLEVWNSQHTEVSQFTFLRGLWTLEDGQLSGSYYGEPAECYTGQLMWGDYTFEGTVIPKSGSHHLLMFRVQGGIRSYSTGLGPNGKFVLLKNANGYKELHSVDFLWEYETEYRISVSAVGNRFDVSVNGRQIMTYTDVDRPYLNGMVGFSNHGGSHTHYKSCKVKGE